MLGARNRWAEGLYLRNIWLTFSWLNCFALGNGLVLPTGRLQYSSNLALSAW